MKISFYFIPAYRHIYPNCLHAENVGHRTGIGGNIGIREQCSDGLLGQENRLDQLVSRRLSLV